MIADAAVVLDVAGEFTLLKCILLPITAFDDTELDAITPDAVLTACMALVELDTELIEPSYTSRPIMALEAAEELATAPSCKSPVENAALPYLY